ncbi:radical SAM family heme chaperone HemW [Dehalogenimonas alkenigignens]|uniref:radical SAM family heme chaperone HemW n=1 Tax=Dehalogenimonas alkenigignens TaxID=1217799 RepID=UPI000D56C775|nr:radical SAM family heme chaperone HemW [Dehalogenimonas alkenigignens]PVV84822.1 coproporphyrinogen III oxidase [Dehalogenimonas alkenigignens]
MTSELSLYFHIPFCRRKCSYCSFISYAGREGQVVDYVEALIIELRLTRRPGAVVRTIYFGGGTPSLLSAGDVGRILDAVRQYYHVDSRVEITLEANPGTVDEDYLRRLRQVGVNRLSLGVQSLDDGELIFLGRLHTAVDAKRTVEKARAAGFTNLSLDFIYGLPSRCLTDWDSMLDGIIALGADHLSLYGLTLEPGTKLGEAAARGELPAVDPDRAASEYELASARLSAAGYQNYEISNWSKVGFESRHNLVYWRRGEYRGLGVAAHSLIDERRIANTDSLDGYVGALASGNLPPHEIEIIGQAGALSESVILGLRLADGISLDDIGRQYKIDLDSRYAAVIGELSGFGLVEVSGGRLQLTPRGRLLGNEVFIRFLPDE